MTNPALMIFARPARFVTIYFYFIFIFFSTTDLQTQCKCNTDNIVNANQYFESANITPHPLVHLCEHTLHIDLLKI